MFCKATAYFWRVELLDKSATINGCLQFLFRYCIVEILKSGGFPKIPPYTCSYLRWIGMGWAMVRSPVRVHVSRSFFSDYPTGASLIRVSTFFVFLALFSRAGAGRILCLHRVSLQEETGGRTGERGREDSGHCGTICTKVAIAMEFKGAEEWRPMQIEAFFSFLLPLASTIFMNFSRRMDHVVFNRKGNVQNYETSRISLVKSWKCLILWLLMFRKLKKEREILVTLNF